MNSKAIKKQLMAAIAMVVVAAVALGSATYAWFVTNNTVTATTSTISAQSNAAFMTIEEGTTGAKNSDATTATYKTTGSIALYPARVKADAALTFETAYGTSTTDGTLKSGTLVDVGTPSVAVTKTFAKQNDFNISTKGTNLTNMKVQSVAMSTESGEFTTSEINSAVRVLIVCGDNWEVWDPTTGKCVQSKTNTTTTPSGIEASVLAATIETGTDTVVNTYIYYDGDDSNIFTNNLSDLTTSSNVVITFTATAPSQV
ncbi:MAG: hypothetical protein ACI4LC_07695 [Emergencia sp.]